MPTRRRPNRPPIVSVSEHSKQAFRGALSGSSAVPQPTDRSIKMPVNKAASSPKVLFQQDEFVVGQSVFIDPVTSSVTLNLTFDPIEHSEHLFWHSTYVEPAPEPPPTPPTPPAPIYFLHAGYGATLFWSSNNWDASWQDGDLLVAVASSSQNSSITVPSGWTSIGEWSVNRCHTVVAARYREGVGSESGAFVGADYGAGMAFRCETPIWAAIGAADTVASVTSTECLLPNIDDVWPWQFMAFARDVSGGAFVMPSSFTYFSGSTSSLYYTAAHDYLRAPVEWPLVSYPSGYGPAPLTTFSSSGVNHSYVRGTLCVVRV